MLTRWFNFAKYVDYLLEPYADRVGSKKKKRKYIDFEYMTTPNNWHDDQVQSQDDHITRPP